MKLDTTTILKRLQPKQLKIIASDVQTCCARYAPNGQTILAGSFIGTIARWEVAGDDCKPLEPLTGHHGFVQCVQFHPDGRFFSADSWGQLRCSTGWKHESAHDGWIRKLALSPDGQLIASVGMDQMLRLWSCADGKQVRECKIGDDAFSLVFHPDGQRIFVGTLHGLIQEWSLAGVRSPREFDAKVMFKIDRIQEVGGVRHLLVSAEGKTLVGVGAQPTTGGFVQAIPTLIAWDIDSTKAKQTVTFGADNEGYIHDAAWHPEGFLMLATSGQPGMGKLHWLALGEEKPFFTLAIPNAHALSLHPSGKRLIVSATNANSSGNGRVKGKDPNDYPGNQSPLHLFALGG